MKVYTKTGDQGTTSLLGGTRVSKSNLKLEAYGTLDELNSIVGLVRTASEDSLSADLVKIQETLFTLGSLLASEPEAAAKFKLQTIEEEDIQHLEQSIDEMEKSLDPLRNFILPGGDMANAYAHLARTVCRRAERGIITLQKQEEIPENSLQYLNRLSDYFFVLARYLTKLNNAEETPWMPRK